MKSDLLSISEPTVSIKTLAVGAKQLTLSTFRQIPEHQIFDDARNLRGNPWGHVNYWWDKFPQRDLAYIHILWERDGQLFRCRANTASADKENIIGLYITNTMTEIAEIDFFLFPSRNNDYSKTYGYPPAHYEEDGKFEEKSWWGSEQRDNIIKAYEKSKKLQAEMPMKKETLLKKLEEEKKLATIIAENYRRNQAIILSLPQLFIAV